MALARLNKQNLNVFISQTQIHGIQDITASYQMPIEHLKFLGMDSSYYIPNGPKQATLSITSLLTSNNNFINFTGDTGVYGFIINKNAVGGTNPIFGFQSGYLTNYTCSCQIGQVPTVKADFAIFNDAGDVASVGASNTTSIPSLGNPNSISFSIGDFSTNRITSFNLSINTPRLPVYYLGNSVPAIVKPIYPMELNCDFTVQMDNLVMQALSDLSYNLKFNNNFLITMRDFLGQSLNFDFTNRLCYFVNNSEEFTTSVTSPTEVLVRYKGYLK
jgi:hypothetical protein